MKRVFNSIYPSSQPYGLNDIKITFFPLMPDIFTKDNYVISVNYNKDARNDNRVFNTEILISDFNEGMNIGMVQKMIHHLVLTVGVLKILNLILWTCIEIRLLI